MGADGNEKLGGAGAHTASTDGPGRARPERIERLIEVLEAADVAFRSESVTRREHALADGLSAIAALYGGLDATGSPEVSTHLEAVYDACLRALGDAYGGDLDALAAAVAMARAIRAALRPASPSARPSRGPGVRRAA